MRRYTVSLPVGFVMLWLVGGCDSPPATNPIPQGSRSSRVLETIAPSQREAAATIEKLGGEVSIDITVEDPLAYKVDFSETKIRDDDLKELAGLSSINELDLSGTSITDEGLKHLAVLPNLEHLGLARTKITRQGLQNLTELPNLRRISLIRVPLTDDDIGPLMEMKDLQTVAVQGTKISEQAKDELRKAVPGLQIQ